MSDRSRVENRANLIFEFLDTNRGKRYTMRQLCLALRINDGSVTRSAVRRAREMATEKGLHFPPAVPQNEHTYTVTDLPQDALDPSLQMQRIESGVRIRKEDGIEFMRRERSKLPPNLRPIVDMHLTVYDTAKQALSTIQKAADDMTVELIKTRREHRGDEQP